jgi:hypothetical protein
MKKDISNRSLTYTYMELRQAVGWIGIFLPFVLMLGVFVIFKGELVLKTISLYYFSGMRDVFVGSLCAIALFMFYYRGYDKWDNIAGNLTGFFALCVALFPTSEKGFDTWQAIVHFISASLFFLTLACFSLFLFTRKSSVPTKRKMTRNKIYISCGLVMIACMISIIIFYIFFEKRHPETDFIFWAETLALIAFGVSWLTKGGKIFPDEKVPDFVEDVMGRIGD